MGGSHPDRRPGERARGTFPALAERTLEVRHGPLEARAFLPVRAARRRRARGVRPGRRPAALRLLGRDQRVRDRPRQRRRQQAHDRREPEPLPRRRARADHRRDHPAGVPGRDHRRLGDGAAERLLRPRAGDRRRDRGRAAGGGRPAGGLHLAVPHGGTDPGRSGRRVRLRRPPPPRARRPRRPLPGGRDRHALRLRGAHRHAGGARVRARDGPRRHPRARGRDRREPRGERVLDAPPGERVRGPTADSRSRADGRAWT